MNDIIGVKMPAPTAIELIKTIYASNRMVNVIREQGGWSHSTFTHDIKSDRNDSITITSISIKTPMYSIGDRVLILATGEVNTITKGMDIVGYIGVYDDEGHDETYHWSEIVKLPATSE